MSEETWEMIKKRKEAKLRSEAGGVDDPEVKLTNAEYWSPHSEVRHLSRRDKRRQLIAGYTLSPRRSAALSLKMLTNGVGHVTGEISTG
ncbi:hypothetical protein E2C01_055390 [Portunus trituberculatus]|uniref:Uncharacterized protein n=1 Tax=Portunus trituberculatus TaxID=210409 RepID=A0A5B7GMB4_PORTR|nr:hypothetical protein [Portunus trituberculatus]